MPGSRSNCWTSGPKGPGFLAACHHGLGGLLGTHHHGVRHQHLQACLNEYVFRFNRHLYTMGMLNSVLGIATRVKVPTYRALYDGNRQHPSPQWSSVPTGKSWCKPEALATRNPSSSSLELRELG